jgi:hypothetical protein
LLSFLGLTLVLAGLLGASAFTAMNSGARTVTASVVGDSAAYLALAVNGSSPDKGFVTTSNGNIVLNFANGVATGTGINPGSGYYFDDLLNVTNQGTATLKVQVNATATTGALSVCVKTVGGQMDNSCYGTSTAQQSLAVGSMLSVGVAVNATGLNSGQTVSGSITFAANR